MLIRRVALVMLVVWGGFIQVQGDQPTDLPDDSRGRCVRMFLETVHDPTPERVTGFETEFATAERRAKRSPATALDRMRDLNHQCGRVAIEQVLALSGSAITITLQQERGEPLAVEFRFSPTEAGKLEDIMITPLREAVVPQAIDAEIRAAAVNRAARLLEKHYVFPEKGEAMAALVRENLKSGAYDSITDDLELSRRLTRDFQSITQDKHLRVRLSPTADGLMASGSDQSPATPPAPPPALRADNSGFKKVEVLDGNIGYVRFDFFEDSEEARQTAAAAMAFVSRCDAVIFDMRHNGGGSPEMVRFISSYLFDEKTHLNDMVDRKGRTVNEFWTLESVPGRRLGPKPPVFVLTSAYTFSGAEEFTYNLKNLKRGLVVGETTGGGAHPVRGARIDDRLMITIPFMRARNPITQSNWEGTGIEPDIRCASDDALEQARSAAARAIHDGENAAP